MHLTLNKDGAKTPAVLGTLIHTTTSDEETANVVVLTTEAIVAEGAIVSIKRAGIELLGDAVITFVTNTIVITDGASTYAATAGDVIDVIYFGGA